MKKPIKINTNREPLSSDEIKSHQNFKSTWQKQYLRPKPFYKNPKFFGGFIVLVVIGVVIILDVFEKRNEHALPKLEISEPIKSINIKADTVSIEAEHGDTIINESGTQLIIPNDCFMNEQGDTVKGKVDIAFREFSSSLDLFLCGIPMAYDSAGMRHQFESAGMMEIQGYQNNKPIYIRKTKRIKVNMATTDSNEGINLYRFDKGLKNWVMIGKDSINDAVAEHAANEIINDKSILPEVQQTQSLAINYIHRKQDSKEAIKLKPIEPTALKPNFEKFTIDFNEDDFPELCDFKNVKFQLLDSTIKINNETLDAVWEAVTLEQLKNRYQVSFYAQDNVLKYQVIPAFEGKDLKKANDLFKEKMASYNKALTEKKNLEMQAQQQLLLSIAASNQKAKLANKAFNNKQANLDQTSAQQMSENENGVAVLDENKVNASIASFNKRAELITKVTRSFEISGFGIYNCDRFLSQKDYQSYSFEVDIPKQIVGNGVNTYLVYKSVKTVVSLYCRRENEMIVLIKNPLDCKLMIVVDDNTIAVCSGTTIKKAIETNDSNLDFELQTINTNKESLSEIFTF
jgi:hypothetical protein